MPRLAIFMRPSPTTGTFFATRTGMTKLTTGMLLGFGAAIAGWWYYGKLDASVSQAEQGEVIFSNTPRASER
jgi:hypothetical protein